MKELHQNPARRHEHTQATTIYFYIQTGHAERMGEGAKPDGPTSTEVKLDPSLYSLEMAYATAYIFLDRAWILFKGDPSNEIIVKITPKDGKSSAEKMGDEFCNQIVSVTNYFNMLERNRSTVNLLLQRALFSASPKARSEAEEAEIGRILEEVGNANPHK